MQVVVGSGQRPPHFKAGSKCPACKEQMWLSQRITRLQIDGRFRFVHRSCESLSPPTPRELERFRKAQDVRSKDRSDAKHAQARAAAALEEILIAHSRSSAMGRVPEVDMLNSADVADAAVTGPPPEEDGGAPIELHGVLQRLDHCVATAENLDGMNINDTDGVANKRESAARIGRDLLHLADTLELSANLVREQYWRIKGYA
jgi:hypothetical protein